MSRVGYVEFRDEVADFLCVSSEQVRAIQNAMQYLMLQHMIKGDSIRVFPGLTIHCVHKPEQQKRMPDGRIETIPEHYVYTPRITEKLRRAARWRQYRDIAPEEYEYEEEIPDVD